MTALLVLSSIPVVMFALWAEYFKMAIDALEKERSEINRNFEFYRARIAGLFATLLQLVIFLSTHSIREERPLAGILIPIFALFIQGQIQFSVERKVRKVEATPTENLKLTGRGFFWSLVGAFCYASCVFLAVLSAIGLGTALGWGNLAMTATVLFGTFVGIGAAVAINFGLGPFYLRRILPVRALSDEEAAVVRGVFSQAGLKAPALWAIQLSQFRFSNAFVAGFSGGRGIFKPALFISESLFQSFSAEEFRAVICHEVAHLSKGHLGKRLWHTIGLSAGTFAFAGVFVFLSMKTGISGEAAGWIGPAAGVCALFFSLRRLRRQAADHEREADLAAVTDFGSDPESLVSALRKLDILNDQRSDRKVSAFMNPSSGHPATEHRIVALRQALATRVVPQESQSHDQAA